MLKDREISVSSVRLIKQLPYDKQVVHLRYTSSKQVSCLFSGTYTEWYT